jgi:hypothetical protein
MRWFSLFLACQHLNSGTNLRECEDQSWFKVQTVPVFHFDPCKVFSSTPGETSTSQVEDHCSEQQTSFWSNLLVGRGSFFFLIFLLLNGVPGIYWYCHTVLGCDFRQGFGLKIGYSGLFYTVRVYTLQITVDSTTNNGKCTSNLFLSFYWQVKTALIFGRKTFRYFQTACRCRNAVKLFRFQLSSSVISN